MPSKPPSKPSRPTKLAEARAEHKRADGKLQAAIGRLEENHKARTAIELAIAKEEENVCQHRRTVGHAAEKVAGLELAYANGKIKKKNRRYIKRDVGARYRARALPCGTTINGRE